MIYIYRRIFNLLKIRNKGKNNTIHLGKMCYLRKKSRIRINGNDNNVYIDDGIYKDININIVGDNNTVKILNTTRINDLKIIIQNNFNSVTIGKNVAFTKSLIVSCGKNNHILIDDDCMISTNTEIWGCDGHSILKDGEIINLSKSIYIGKHTWIGANAKILKGANIQENCVIGANSLVTSGKIKNNSLIAGNPAKIIKENITWVVDNLEN